MAKNLSPYWSTPSRGVDPTTELMFDDPIEYMRLINTPRDSFNDYRTRNWARRHPNLAGIPVTRRMW